MHEALDLSFNKIFSSSLIFFLFELILKGVINVILLLFLMYPLSPTKLNMFNPNNTFYYFYIIDVYVVFYYYSQA